MSVLTNIIPYEEEIVSLNIYERIELSKTIRKERESIFMTKLVYFIILINIIGIIASMFLVLYKLLLYQ